MSGSNGKIIDVGAPASCTWPRGCSNAPLVGASRCKRHGGMREINMRLRERDYGSLLGVSGELRDAFEKYYADPDICDCRAELALQRAMLASALAKVRKKDPTGDLTGISVEAMAAITELNQAVAKLALTVDALATKNPSTLNAPQVDWLLEAVISAVSDALEAEILGPVEVPFRVPDGDGEILVDQDGVEASDDGRRTRPAELCRARVLRRIADAMEAFCDFSSSRRLPSQGKLVPGAR